MFNFAVIICLNFTRNNIIKCHFTIARACVRMYTNKQLYSVIASLAPLKERFRVAAGCNTKNALKIEALHTLIVIKICARADSSF